jgi:hypothetical protein
MSLPVSKLLALQEGEVAFIFAIPDAGIGILKINSQQFFKKALEFCEINHINMLGTGLG